METNKYIEKLKKEYLKLSPPKTLVEQGWTELEKSLAPQEKFLSLFVFRRGVLFAVIVLFLSFGILFGSLVQAAQGAFPGEPLYPIKRLSEEVIFLTPDKEKVERRADEIIELTKKGGNKDILGKSIRGYKKTILETKKEILNSGKGKKELDESLNLQEKRFREVIKQQSSEEVREAIEIAREGRNGRDDIDGDRKEEDKKEDRETK
ncbi:MAG: hypothetical protein HYU80_02795 [Candidatus Blackburnbacteria bacterium]|nr:hypothetical protein [Candidatus Blackburnbacteria bacterium]